VNPCTAKVYLVGAGPGDPGLLTLRGRECLARADVVIYDYLASRELLKFAPPEAELISVGSPDSGRKMPQTEIEQELISAAQSGKCVVRLKGGDPGIFGRLAEEATALRRAGIAFEVVPGVSTAVSAGAYAGIAVTSRGDASCVAFVTGMLRDGTHASEQIDFAALAAFPGTLVFYMGARSAKAWSRALIEQGKPADTPVVFVRRVTMPNQQTWSTTLAELPDLLSNESVAPPLVAIVGQVAARQEVGAWFTQRPLFGQTILVTRPEQQSAVMVNRLVELGAEVLQQPAIAIGPPRDREPLDTALQRIHEFDWIVFSSRNGVDYFFDSLADVGRDARALVKARLASIGPATSEALASRGLFTDLAPTEYRAEALAAELSPVVKDKQVLLVRASRGREVLAEELTSAGAQVTQAVAYESRDVDSPDLEIVEALTSGRVTWTTVTSSAIARSLVGMFGDDVRRAKLASISPITSGVLRELGHPPAAEAEVYTTDGVVQAIAAQETSSDSP
jgi:uroporphyrinogen III methyltransferase / synthase